MPNNKMPMVRRLLAFALSFALLVGVPRLCAQSTFGNIVGSVRDTSGAVVAAAEIVAREIDQNTARSAKSDSEGLYEVLNLKPGRYEITAAKSGFATAKIAEARLEARQTLRLELKLEVAAVEQAIEVSSSVPLINTENAIIADTKTFEEITQLPLNYRGATTSPLSATMIVPGVQHDAFNRPSIGGGLPAQIEYTVDGISTHSSYEGPNYDMYPSTEMLSEFKVTSVNNNAEFGQMGDVTVITRGGTNRLRGSAFWYHQNSALDPTIYGSPEKQHKVFNTFGGSLSGPVYLPGIYGGRDRTFFFVDYEPNRQPNPSLEQFSVPTAAMRAGDLNGVPGGPVVDPLTGGPFPGNVIPSTRINPVAKTLFEKFYPLPNYNTGGTTYNNFRRLFPAFNDTGGYDVRIDHNLSSRQQIYGRWSWKKISAISSNSLLPPSDLHGLNRNLIISHNYSIRPNLFNEFRFGLSRLVSSESFPILGTEAVATLGLQGLDLSNSQGVGGFPIFDFGDGTGFTGIGHFTSTPFESRSGQLTDNLSWIRGRHTMKFGVDLRRIGWGDGVNAEFGVFYFLQGAFSGNAFADLLLGLPTFDRLILSQEEVNEQALHTHVYGQDEWRANDHLTVSFGLRWSLHPPMTEAAGRITNFDRRNGNVIVPDHTPPAAPSFLAAINACPGTTTTIPCTHIVNASQAGLGQGLRRTYFGNWAPRLGLAWRPFSNKKTVLRSGFGIFTTTVGGRTASALFNVHSHDDRYYFNYRGPDTPPLFALPQISAGGFPLPEPGTGGFAVATDLNFKDPRSYQWSFTIERELPRDTGLRLSYIGSQSVGVTLLVDLNSQPPSKLPFSASRRPYLAWDQLLSLENLGFASYNALQAEVTHRFRRGLSFQSSYVLSKNIGNVGGTWGGMVQGQGFPIEVHFEPGNRFDTGSYRGDLGGSRRHRFLLTGIYQLPFGKGRAFATRMNPLANAILGGWDLSTITLLQSGTFQTPGIGRQFDQSNTSMYGSEAPPDRIGDGNLANPTPDRWWDVTAFTPTPKGAGRFGNSGVGILRGPGTIAIAGGLFKSFSLAEKVRLRLEATFTNLPNHPNFAMPAFFVDQPGFGQTTSVQSQENSGNRVGQVGVRFDW